MRQTFSKLRTKALIVAAVCALSTGAFAPAQADESVRAVWKVQEITLPYFGLTTHYSCDGLRDKMREILTDLGAREDFLVRIAGCTSLTGPERLPSVVMVLATAVPANDETTKMFASDPKRAELLARMQKAAKGGMTYSDEPFDAVMKQVTLRSKDTVSPGASGNCELLEQMKRDVLPKIGAKVVSDNVRCTPHQGTPGNPTMTVEVLVPVSNER